MKHFEEQVSQAAARLRNEENSRLRVPGNPRRSGGISWGWVATPVAAVVGLLWGVELGRMSGESSLQRVSQVIDTVIRRTAPVRRIQVANQKQGLGTRLYRRGRGNVFWKTASTIPCFGRL